MLRIILLGLTLTACQPVDFGTYDIFNGWTE